MHRGLMGLGDSGGNGERVVFDRTRGSYGLIDVQGWRLGGGGREVGGGLISNSKKRPSHHKHKSPKQFL